MSIWMDKIIHCSACSAFDPLCNIAIYERTNNKNEVERVITYPIYFGKYELDDKYDNIVYRKFSEINEIIEDKSEVLSYIFITLYNIFTHIFFDPIAYTYRLFYLLKNKKIDFVYDVMLDDNSIVELLKYDSTLDIHKDDYYNVIDSTYTINRKDLILYMKLRFVLYGDIKLTISIDPNDHEKYTIEWYKV